MKAKKRKGKIVLVAFTVLLLLLGCSQEINKEDSQIEINASDEYGITITKDKVSFIDGSGAKVDLSKNPKRTIVLFASYVDIWIQNGGNLVGMVEPQAGKEIAGTEEVETVGKTGAFSLEKIISLEPELVILSANTSSQAELIPSLKETGIQVLALDYTFKEDYFKTVKLFTALNNRDDLYQENAVKIQKEIENIISMVPKEDHPKVFIMFASSKSIKSRGTGTTLGQMLSDLKTINIADLDKVTLEDKDFSMETIIKEDPDFIFVQRMGSEDQTVLDKIKEEVQSNPAWSSLSAVKNDRYILLPKDLYTYKANERYPEAYRKLAEILYPDIFK